MFKHKLVLLLFSLILTINIAAAADDPIEKTLLNDINTLKQVSETPASPDQDAAKISQTYQKMSDTIDRYQTSNETNHNGIFNMSIYPALIAIVKEIEDQCDNLLALIASKHRSQNSDENKVNEVLNKIDSQSSRLSQFISTQNSPTVQVNDYNNPSIPNNMRKSATPATQIYGN